MNKAIYLIALLISFSACSKDIDSYISLIPTQEELAGQPEESEDPAENPENPAENPENPAENPGDPSSNLEPTSVPGNLPYSVPSVKTADDFPNKIYIDPGYTGGNSNGSFDRPYTSINRQYSRGIPANTAILIKRGTTLDEKIGRLNIHPHTTYENMVYNNNLIGAYGQGSSPVVRGFWIAPNANGLTIRDLHIYGESQMAEGWDALIYFHTPRGSDVTIANNLIEGKHNPSNYLSPFPYPYHGISVKCDNLVVFNNIIKGVWTNGITIDSGTNHKYVRNYIYDINKQQTRAIAEGWPTANSADPDSENPGGRGDVWWSRGSSHNFYVAGNYFDGSNVTWKQVFISNANWDSNNSNFVIEYNTFVGAPAVHAGGQIYFNAPSRSIFRYNLINSTNSGAYVGKTPLASTWPVGAIEDHLKQPYPYGIRYNHIIRQDPQNRSRPVTWPDADRFIPESNKIFDTWAQYQSFIQSNISAGSDIDPLNF